MLEAIKALAERSVVERLVLLVNHVIAAEPAALERLRPHAARTMQIELTGWPALLPAVGPFAFRVSPAGLVEWLPEASSLPPDLRVAVFPDWETLPYDTFSPHQDLISASPSMRPTRRWR